jgi:phosphoribosyl 1,2-cyclic phosphodiesterase
VIETTHYEALLQNDTTRPWSTKQRISSRHGHLSNDQAAELISEIAHPALSNVVLGQLSDDCNDPDLASKRIRSALDAAGAKDARVVCAERRKPTPTLEVARTRPSAVFQLVGAVESQMELL